MARSTPQAAAEAAASISQNWQASLQETARSFAALSKNPMTHLGSLVEANYATARAVLEVTLSAAASAFDVADRQRQIAQETLEETGRLVSSILTAPPEDRISTQIACAKTGLEKIMTSGKELSTLITQCQLQTANAYAQCLSEGARMRKSA